ncbi:MAG: class A sortase [Lactobacillales bacterium]|jgi:sortase A|nr:class A sortase [Lactobacillales bacterium]
MAKEKKKKGKLKRALGNFLILLLILIGLALVFNNQIKDFLIGLWGRDAVTHVTAKEIKDNQDAPATFDFDDVQSASTQALIKARLSKQRLHVLGAIAIPEVKLNLPVFKGVSNLALLTGAGTMKEEQVMGGMNNYSLASHWMYNPRLLFAPLKRVKVGNTIYLTDLTMVYTYRVTQKYEINKEHGEVIFDHDGKSEVTLVTCSGRHSETRVIVTGELESEVEFDKAPDDILNALNQNLSNR